MRFTAVLVGNLLMGTVARAQQWMQPTPDELAMTSIPEVPGAAAVYLYREDVTDDTIHQINRYVRLKVLTDRGKEYANVTIPYVKNSAGYTVDAVSGRTIHPDGSVVMLTGKPYDKLIDRGAGYKVKEKVFTLPAVEAGSIIEYRYRLGYDEGYFFPPEWIVQSDLYLRKAHFRFKATSHNVQSGDGMGLSSGVAWTPILPNGVKVEQKGRQITLDIQDVAPLPKEAYMPAVASLSYRVLFYYSDVHDPDQFWERRGKMWTGWRDRFMGPYPAVQKYVGTVVGSADTQDAKARKLYAAVTLLENTDFTRERTVKEEKAEGLKAVETSDDVLVRKRGTGDQITELFVAMCRAAGLKAYVAAVSDRSQRIFLPAYLSMDQLDDYIAIVSIDGKEVYFDPGQRYCEPEHLPWKHTLMGGLRQTDAGTALFTTPGESFSTALTKRTADLTLDEHGLATGTATLMFTGDPALHWRQRGLKGDDTSLHEDLRSYLEETLPRGMEVRVTSVDNLAEYDKPLTVKYELKGAVASAAGKRLAVPADLFETNVKPRFPEPKRELAVDMRYPSMTQDAVRIRYPATLTVESAPPPAKAAMASVASYETLVKPGVNSISLYRNLINGKTIYKPDVYNDLRSFYTKVETADQELLVLTQASASSHAATGTPAAEVHTRRDRD